MGIIENLKPIEELFSFLWFSQLAELWPDGLMDNVGIKLAVLRAKGRKAEASNVNTICTAFNIYTLIGRNTKIHLKFQ